MREVGDKMDVSLKETGVGGVAHALRRRSPKKDGGWRKLLYTARAAEGHIGLHAAALLMMRIYPERRYGSMMLKGLVPVIWNWFMFSIIRVSNSARPSI